MYTFQEKRGWKKILIFAIWFMTRTVRNFSAQKGKILNVLIITRIKKKKVCLNRSRVGKVQKLCFWGQRITSNETSKVESFLIGNGISHIQKRKIFLQDVNSWAFKITNTEYLGPTSYCHPDWMCIQSFDFLNHRQGIENSL